MILIVVSILFQEICVLEVEFSYAETPTPFDQQGVLGLSSFETLDHDVDE